MVLARVAWSLAVPLVARAMAGKAARMASGLGQTGQLLGHGGVAGLVGKVRRVGEETVGVVGEVGVEAGGKVLGGRGGLRVARGEGRQQERGCEQGEGTGVTTGKHGRTSIALYRRMRMRLVRLVTAGASANWEQWERGGLVEAGAAEEAAAGAADELAAALRQAGGTVGAEHGVVLCGQWAGVLAGRVGGLRRFRLHGG